MRKITLKKVQGDQTLGKLTISNGSSYLVELDLQEDVVPSIWRSENVFNLGWDGMDPLNKKVPLCFFVETLGIEKHTELTTKNPKNHGISRTTRWFWRFQM